MVKMDDDASELLNDLVVEKIEEIFNIMYNRIKNPDSLHSMYKHDYSLNTISEINLYICLAN